MNEQELKEVFGTINDFDRLVLNEIKNVHKVATIGSLILMLCAVDYLKSFRFGLKAIDKNTFDLLKEKYGQNERLDRINREELHPSKYYKDFIREYLMPINDCYNPEDIYKNLRCGLVHNYSDRIFKYHFVESRHQDKSAFHLMSDGKGIYFNVDNFYIDFMSMCRVFFKEAKNKEEIQRNIFDFRSFVGFLHVFDS